MVIEYGLMLIFSVYWTFRRKSIESRIVGNKWKRNIKIFKDIPTIAMHLIGGKRKMK